MHTRRRGALRLRGQDGLAGGRHLDHAEAPRASKAEVAHTRSLSRPRAKTDNLTHATEIGTATAWTTVAFALADSGRRVRSYDPEVHPERERYLNLARPVRDRIELHRHRAEEAQPAPASTGLVFVDGAHDRESTIDAYRTFAAAVQPGGAMAFHDYGHPRYPGVSEAVQELGLRGEVRGGMFVWRKDASTHV